MPLKIGSLVDERYHVTARIGHGGTAEVYEANDIINRQTVAIKLIRDDVMSNPVNLKRFQNEATIVAILNHPNIVRVYNHGYIDGKPYIVNEYINGQTLKDVLDFRGGLPISEAISIMVQLTAALQCAHEHGIIHRDIKTQNILYMPDGTIKLGDFGIAESENIQPVNPSTKGDKEMIIGSVHYLAPEISKGGPASVQSDIYAAGVTFFEIVTGHLPYEDANADAVSVAVAHIKDRFPSPRRYLPSCPKEIENVIFKAVEKNPHFRYKDAKAFNAALVNIQNNPALLKEKKSWIARLFGFK